MVYNIICNDWDASNWGNTKRKLETRAKEHKCAFNKPLYVEHWDNWFLKLVQYYLNEYIFKNHLKLKTHWAHYFNGFFFVKCDASFEDTKNFA